MRLGARKLAAGRRITLRTSGYFETAPSACCPSCPQRRLVAIPIRERQPSTLSPRTMEADGCEDSRLVAQWASLWSLTLAGAPQAGQATHATPIDRQLIRVPPADRSRFLLYRTTLAFAGCENLCEKCSS